MNPIAIRLLAQQLICPQADTPAQTVAHMGAIQAQDYRMMRWAVMMRTRKPDGATFRAAYDSGEIVRLHLLRGTWQLVSAHDYWWMLDLCADKAQRVIRGWMRANHVEIDDHELHRVRDVLVQTCLDLGSATKDDMAQALTAHGMDMDAHRLSYHLRLAELSGTLCSGRLSAMQATYTLACHKVRRTEPIERQEMLARLARLYFQSHSPATLADYQWWSGLSTSDCQQSIALLGDELATETWHGHLFYIHATCRRRGFRRGSWLLLPPFDEYLIGYKTRHVAIAPEHTARAYTNNGIFFPTVAHNGTICGNWKPWASQLHTTLWTGEGEAAAQSQWDTFCQTMGSAETSKG